MSPPPTTPDLRVRVAGIDLKNPVIAASGTFGYGVEFEDIVHLDRLGGLVVKGLSREPMTGNPPPRLYETAAGMLNAIGLQNIGAQAFLDEKLPSLSAKKNVVVFANVFGYTRADYERTIEILNQGEGIAAYELNVSCPNTAHGGIQFGTDPHSLDEVVERDLHRSHGTRGRRRWRRRHLAGEHIHGHGHRRGNSPPAHCQRHRRPFRSGNKADRIAHGVRSVARGQDPRDWHGRHRHSGGRSGIHAGGRKRGRGRHRELLRSRGHGKARRGFDRILP
jgi:hypothetical protein